MSDVNYVLLDANMLIGAFDHDANNPQHVAAKKQVKQLLSNNNIKIAITPLIRYEVLRGVRRISFADMQAILNDFEEFEITDIESTLASKIYRLGLASKPLVKLDKRSFDVFHYAVAKTQNLQLNSFDGDLTTIDNLYKQNFNH